MNKIYNFEDYCAPTLAEQIADISVPWEDVPPGFRPIAHIHYTGKQLYIARTLDPRIVTYCPHVKGAKAYNLPF